MQAHLHASSPSAIFADLKEQLKGMAKDPEIAEIFNRVLKFKAQIHVDGERLTALKERGAKKLGLELGQMPFEMAPGLIAFYDATLEAIRLNPNAVRSMRITPRLMRTAEALLPVACERLGDFGVTAIEQALEDKNYADRLHERAEQLGWSAFDNQWDPDVCEFCTVSIKDSTTGVITTTCPSQEECSNLGWLILIFLLIWLTIGILRYLTD